MARFSSEPAYKTYEVVSQLRNFSHFKRDGSTSVCNESRADQLSDENGQVGSDRHHAVANVVVQLRSVLCDFQHLKQVEVASIAVDSI